MSTAPTALQAIAGVAVAWGVWKVLALAFRKDPLRNIQGPPTDSWYKGNHPKLMKPDGWKLHKEMMEQYGGVVKFKGFLGESMLYVHDPKALQHVIVKEQHIYEESDLFISANELNFGPGLLATLGKAFIYLDGSEGSDICSEGDQHRKQRKMLNPVFSIAHMREMIPIFYDVVHKLGDAFEEKVKNGPATIEVLNWMTRTALELIGQSGLGYSFDPLTENGKEHRFSVSAKLLVPAGMKLNFWRFVVIPRVSHIGPKWFRRAVIDFLSLFWTDLRRYRDIIDVIADTSKEILDEKKEALRRGDEGLKAQVGRGRDIMSILLKANMSASEEDRLSDDELLGQMSYFPYVQAAMDTTSSALSRILHLMCLYPEAQEKLRREITDAQDSRGQLNYDDLVSLPYLDAICRETMRLYAPVPMVLRQAKQDSMLPVSKPIIGADGKPMSEVAMGPDSYEWKPERWLSPLPDTLANAKIPGVYSNLMTFIGGSRACIGFKFSQLEMKVVLVELISRFKFELGEHKNIFWQMAGIVTPLLEENSILEPQLPLKVTAVKAVA
ncbi:hypothetical protein NMY22_g14961 [Coprinellus aureogranulatus]|nr:hypothetical protein NMY22_g14961 [Coprinellus aureogranulatus]